MMGIDLLDPARHAGALAIAAARALRAGDIDRAHALADRRCRIRPPAEAHDFLLRSAARRALGDAEGAIADAKQAAAIDPDNRIAARWLLRAPDASDRVAAARAVLRVEAGGDLVGEAVAILAGADAPAIGVFRAGDAGIEGWLAWRGTEPFDLTVAGAGTARTVPIRPDPAHALAAILGSAARVALPWPPGGETVRLGGFGPGAVILGTGFARPFRPAEARLAGDPEPGPRGPEGAPGVTVILPVYDDLAATRLCLETLLADTPRHLARTIVAIDDATPDPEIARLLDDAAARGAIRLLRNSVNLGFAASVNRALAALPAGDVLILNADTVTPPGFLDRLHRAAHSAADIGTVTPLSNNGENTSLPRAFVENPLPSVAEVAAIDAVAAAVNRGRIVDLPNGTGFCLYLTRACLDVVGLFGRQFGRGYLEDVELCLRAAEAGFRNVCAADVYVGHAGSRSFGAGKRALVVRNLALVEAQFPGYERACAAFFSADPLAPVRAAIDARMAPRLAPAHLVVLGEADAEPWLAAHRRIQDGRPVLVARAALRAGRIELVLSDPAGGFPQSLRLSAPLRRGGTRLAASLARLPIASVELPRPRALPDEVRRAVSALGRPSRETPADRPAAPPARLRLQAAIPERVAVLAPTVGIASFRLLAAIVRRWACDGGLPALAVVGETLDDLRLMGLGPVLATGPVPPDEVAALLQRLGASRLILLDPGHPRALAASAAQGADAQTAALVHASGMAPEIALGRAGLVPRPKSAFGPAAIDPTGTPEAVAERLAAWVAGPLVERRVA